MYAHLTTRRRGWSDGGLWGFAPRPPPRLFVHPVSIARFPLRRFSPGAGLLRYVFSLVAAKIFQGLGPKRRESSNGDRVYFIFVRGKPNSDTSGVRRRTENSESELCPGLQRATSQPQHTTRNPRYAQSTY